MCKIFGFRVGQHGVVLLFAILFNARTDAQPKRTKNNFPPSTSWNERQAAYEQQKKLNSTSLLNNIKFESVGPTIMSGRVVDLDVSPADPTQFYVAFASGGLWKTTNNGNSFIPLFDNEAVMTIGDIAVDWNYGETIYVGTGESNSSRSSYAGMGIYKSTDGGKTWTNKGLQNTHHIGRVVIHPANPNVLWVAAIGHLYSYDSDRGVFKSTDGGETWKKTLFIDDTTGVIDLVVDAKNPDILYAASWHRERKAWNFSESGSASGIYKSTDGGNTWGLVSTVKSGFAQGDGTGRIGLAISPLNSKVVYATLDNQTRRPKKINLSDDQTKVLVKDSLIKMTRDAFLKLPDTEIDAYLDEHDFPSKYNAIVVKTMMRENKITPASLVEYTEDANALLFDTDVTGGEVYRSDDAGATWKKQNQNYIEEFYNTYGYYFGQMAINPLNENEIYLAGYQLLKSVNGGKTFSAISADNMHGDFHHIFVDAKRPGHIIVANDGGINISYDTGATFIKCNTPPVGQFYSINFDYATPFNLYGGLQDNGVWQWHQNKSSWNDMNDGRTCKPIMGGDGMQVQIDPSDNNTVYTGYQFGNYYRVDIAKSDETYITPRADLGERPLRWNWQSPITISTHNNAILYFASNKLHRSMNRGEKWETISPDLTLGGKKGDVPYGTITTISESPLQFGVIYTGSDDGVINLTRDGGVSWKNMSAGLPQNYWISRVVASAHQKSRVYVSLNGYRWDNFSALIYASDDYGNTWKQIGKDLPAEPVNVIREDPVNEKIIYVGTDHGLYVSLNGGITFMNWKGDMPSVAIHDLVIHPRDKKIIIGTHGRSAYMADVSLLETLRDTMLTKSFYVYDIAPINRSLRWGQKRGEYEPPAKVSQSFAYYSNKTGVVTMQVKLGNELVLKTLKDSCEAGINFMIYDLTLDSANLASYTNMVNKDKKGDDIIKLKKADDGNYYLVPEKYTLLFNGPANETLTRSFEIKNKKRKNRSDN